MKVCDIKKHFTSTEYLGDGVYVGYSGLDDFTIFLSDGICTYSEIVLDRYVRRALQHFITEEEL